MAIDRDAAILITGGTGLVGRNLVTCLRGLGFSHVCAPSRADCDLTDFAATVELFADVRPAYVFHLAGRVRGLGGNLGAQGIAYLDNALINTHVIEAAHLCGAAKIVTTGTVAMYPDPLPHNPLHETDLWMGKPHASEAGYAQAKRGMLAQLEAYHSNYSLRYAVALCTNLYGPHDRFDAATGHVIPSLIAKFHHAATTGDTVAVWGDGSAQRDFLYVEDCVRALVLVMDKADGVINLATGKTRTIRDAVSILGEHTVCIDRVFYDTTQPNGQLVRSYDVSRLAALGFVTRYSLERGLCETYDWYAANVSTARR